MTIPSRLVPLLPLVVLSTGCEVLGDYLPTVSFERLDVQSVDWDGAQADFVFKVNNPNPVEVKLARFDYALSFAEVEWLVGDDADGLVLGANGGSELALPVGIEFETLYELVQATRGIDTIPFELEGSFGFDSPAGVIDLPYAADGGFPALRTPKFTFNKVRVDELTWSDATIGVDLNVDNDHASNLIFQNFDYRLKIAGEEVGTGFLADLGTVSGADTGVLTIPLTIDFLSSGTAIYEALTNDSVSLGLSAGTEVDTPFGIVPLDIDESGRVNVDL
jgi:LEA14-like dessication related protein